MARTTIRLDPEDEQRIQDLKDVLGMNHTSEVIRHTLARVHQQEVDHLA